MFRGQFSKQFIYALVTVFLFTCLPSLTVAEETAPQPGNLEGFVYGKDGKTPVKNAQILLVEMKEEGEKGKPKIYYSNVTEDKGDYKLLNIPPKNYVVQVRLNKKPYKITRIDFIVTIMEGKTSYVSFSLRKKNVPLAIIILGSALASGALGPSLLVVTEEASGTVR